MIEPDAGQSEFVKDLAEACSRQAKVANRTWLGTMAVSILVLLPRDPASTGVVPTVQLPFELGPVEGTVIYPMAFAILAVLVVAMSVAHAQHIRADKFCNGILEKLDQEVTFRGATVRLREFFDICRESGLTRVAPLAQLVLGNKRGFFGVALYVALKLGVLLVLFATPGIALYLGFQHVRSAGLGRYWVLGLGAAGVIAGISLLVLSIAEVLQIWPRLKKLGPAVGSPAAT